MRNETKEWIWSIAQVVAFILVFGIVGRMEFDAMQERHAPTTWEAGR